ncbi:MAG: hypothetical protein JNM27_21855 [Leptospirales bacterium]|nr:hypothetical protein [Leptospirales bacterium]
MILLISLLCCLDPQTNNLPELSLLAIRARSLNSHRFTYSGANLTPGKVACGGADLATGIGPYSFSAESGDDVLITVSTNYETNVGCASQTSRLKTYMDGAHLHTFYYDRCWGQSASLNTAFIVSNVSGGSHSLDMRICGVPNGNPTIIGSRPTIVTATSLNTSPYFRGKSSAALPIGTTSLPTSGPFVTIGNLSSTYTATEDVLLWQSLSLAGNLSTGLNFRLGPQTTEDLGSNDDGPFPIGIFTSLQLTAGNSVTATGQYSTGTGGLADVVLSPYDSTLNLIAFAQQPSGRFGKATFSGSTGTTTTLVPLLSVPITSASTARYLISLSVNQTSTDQAGGECWFFLYNNGVQVGETHAMNSNNGNQVEAALLTIETIESGTSIPISVQFRSQGAGTTCTVSRAALSVIPLE